jgi:hypothetical protein
MKTKYPFILSDKNIHKIIKCELILADKLKKQIYGKIKTGTKNG